VDLEIIGDCDCENDGNQGFVKKAKLCNHAGDLECGKCICYPGNFGKFCECDITEGAVQGSTVGCIMDNSTGVMCSRRGDCLCGTCTCDSRENKDEKIYGDWCECDNFSCDRHNNLLCNGNGECDCGDCKCDFGWSGKACDCPTNQDLCIMDGGTKPCSGNGVCSCGTCECNSTADGRYTGTYCEDDPSIGGRCSEYKVCVQCQVFRSGDLTEEECANCTFTPIEVNVAQVEKEEEGRQFLCTFRDDDDCRFVFVYGKDEYGELQVYAENTKDCPEDINILAIVIGVIVAIVAVGLAVLLMWKLLTTIHDRNEFAKFEKERMMAKWDASENPIYKQATSTFKNPTYGGKGCG